MKSKANRFLLLVMLFQATALSVVAQILHPADWEHQFSKSEVSIGDQVDLIFRVTIDPKWYLYSSDFDPDLGPKVTEFNFIAHQSYELVGRDQAD